jgi:type IV pilus assembly protein PilV
MTSRRRSRRGYTVVELMMALGVLAVGVTGIIAMQKVTVTSNAQARRLAAATSIVQAWQEQLAADAVAWNHPSVRNGTPDITADTVWLRLVETNQGNWTQPAWNAARSFGPAFDGLARPLEVPANQAQAQYCTHVRLTYLYPPTNPVGNGLIRAEVRVFWPRDGAPQVRTFCNPTDNPETIGQDVISYHFVNAISAIRQNTAP